MPPKKETEEGITWTTENVSLFCDVVISYITKNGRTQLMRWRDLEDLFSEKFGKRVQFKSLKNKYDNMKKEWRLWKFLKTGETGLGWNATTGRLDTRVFLHAIETPSMNFPKHPEGKYYVEDKGYPDRKGYLAPYPRLRYHQSQFEHVLPTNAQEAFNHTHSSLRSCIERSFGVLKKRWKILTRMPSFDEKTQIDVIMASWRNDATYMVFNIVDQHQNYIPTEEQHNTSAVHPQNIQESRNEMRRIRDNIANMIWAARNFN